MIVGRMRSAISITGIVRNGEGRPQQAVKVSLTNTQTSTVTTQTSGASGEFRFDDLPVGEYNLRAAAQEGLSRTVIVSKATPIQKVDLVLQSAAPDAASNSTKPPLKFEAAGVRGPIDPGGYSAPANAEQQNRSAAQQFAFIRPSPLRYSSGSTRLFFRAGKLTGLMAASLWIRDKRGFKADNTASPPRVLATEPNPLKAVHLRSPEPSETYQEMSSERITGQL